MADPFISAQDLADYLGRDVTDDNGATIALDAACDLCRRVSDQTFNRGTTTLSLDGAGTDVLLLPDTPVASAGTVTVNGVAESNFIAAADGRLLRGSAGSDPRPVWPWGRQNVVVTYVHGYTEVPRDVRRVALDLAARMVIQGVSTSESVGGVTVNWGGPASELRPTEKLVLEKYRQRRSF